MDWATLHHGVHLLGDLGGHHLGLSHLVGAYGSPLGIGEHLCRCGVDRV